MAEYQKKIAYLDYLENGMKIKNAGFVKSEENNGQMRLEMRVKNVPGNFNGEYELNADTGGVIGRISLSRGSGGCCVVWQSGTKAPEGKQKVKANGIYIRLPGRHLLQAVWGEPMEVEVDKKKEEPEETVQEEKKIADVMPEAQQTEVREPPFWPEETLPGEPEGGGWEPVREETEEKEMPVYPAWEMAFEPNMQINSMPSSQTETEYGYTERGGAERRQMDGNRQENRDMAAAAPEGDPVCYGDKWEQLSHMYPLTHPFQDEREYLSIAPKDFVVLRQEYQKMVHNSFLLHGYYNYKHLILGKIEEKDGWCFYLGVPGNFYTREKMVAEMFGFEAFEGERNPAEPGDFGYFMKKVEI